MRTNKHTSSKRASFVGMSGKEKYAIIDNNIVLNSLIVTALREETQNWDTRTLTSFGWRSLPGSRQRLQGNQQMKQQPLCCQETKTSQRCIKTGLRSICTDTTYAMHIPCIFTDLGHMSHIYKHIQTTQNMHIVKTYKYLLTNIHYCMHSSDTACP